MAIKKLVDEIVAFRDQREWAQFHTPKNLAAALAIEAAELQEQLLWKSDSEVRDFTNSDTGHEKLSDEVADIFIYTLLFAHSAGIDLEAATRIKLKKNAEKYPVELSKGKASKYNALQGNSS
jgi:NTP pyrophosphatase (non-canonical NTP hydrolase)